jgi:hypothetical protein
MSRESGARIARWLGSKGGSEPKRYAAHVLRSETTLP